MNICRQDDNFSDVYANIGPYIDAIYMMDANSESDRSDPFDVLDSNLQQAIDNNGICFKHIDYTLNEKAETFKDIFEFAECNKTISSNLKSNLDNLDKLIYLLLIITVKYSFTKWKPKVVKWLNGC